MYIFVLFLRKGLTMEPQIYHPPVDCDYRHVQTAQSRRFSTTLHFILQLKVRSQPGSLEHFYYGAVVSLTLHGKEQISKDLHLAATDVAHK